MHAQELEYKKTVRRQTTVCSGCEQPVCWPFWAAQEKAEAETNGFVLVKYKTAEKKRDSKTPCPEPGSTTLPVPLIHFLSSTKARRRAWSYTLQSQMCKPNQKKTTTKLVLAYSFTFSQFNDLQPWLTTGLGTPILIQKALSVINLHGKPTFNISEKKTFDVLEKPL